MNPPFDRIAADLKRFVAPAYPMMDIHVSPWGEDPARLASRFTDSHFALLYPYQRWHYLTHLTPSEYQESQLANSVWFELAPGEAPDDLRYPDQAVIDAITPDVMR